MKRNFAKMLKVIKSALFAVFIPRKHRKGILSAKERGTEITLLQFKEEIFVKKKYWMCIR